jgi:hypothetical protein
VLLFITSSINGVGFFVNFDMCLMIIIINIDVICRHKLKEAKWVLL